MPFNLENYRARMQRVTRGRIICMEMQVNDFPEVCFTKFGSALEPGMWE